jgi:hypothetical protein
LRTIASAQFNRRVHLIISRKVTNELKPSSVPGLDYSRLPRLSFFARWKRSLIVLSIVFAFALAGSRYGPEQRRRVEWLYWSYRCEHYTARKGLERFVTDPAKVRTFTVV